MCLQTDVYIAVSMIWSCWRDVYIAVSMIWSCWRDVYIAVSMIWSCWIDVYIAVSMIWSCWSCVFTNWCLHCSEHDLELLERCLHCSEHDLELLELCVYKLMFTLQWAWPGVVGVVRLQTDVYIAVSMTWSCWSCVFTNWCLHCSEHDLELLERCLHCSEHDWSCWRDVYIAVSMIWSCWRDVYIAVSMIWSCWRDVYIAVSMTWSCWSCGSGQDWSGVMCVVDCWLLWTAPLRTVTWQQRPESWTGRSRLESGSATSSHSKQQLLAHSLLSHISAIVVSVYIRGMAAFIVLISLLLLCVLCVFPCHWLLDGPRCVCTSVDWEKLKTTITIIVYFITPSRKLKLSFYLIH